MSRLLNSSGSEISKKDTSSKDSVWVGTFEIGGNGGTWGLSQTSIVPLVIQEGHKGQDRSSGLLRKVHHSIPLIVGVE